MPNGAWVSFIVVAVTACTDHGAAPRTLSDLLACNDRAVGGEQLRKVGRVGYEMRIEEPGFKAVGRYTAERAGRARIDVYIGDERVFSEGWDGNSGWELPQGASTPVPISPEGTAALRHGVEQPGHLWTLADMPRNGHAVELVGRDSLEGTNYDVLKVRLRDGFELWYWLDPVSCLIQRNRNFRAFHPDLDSTRKWTETRFEDYRSQEGITRSYLQQSVDVATGKVIGTTRVLVVSNHVDSLAPAAQ